MKKMKMTEFSSELLRERYVRVDHQSGLPIYVFPKKLTTTFAFFAVHYGSVDNAFSANGESEPIRVPAGIAHFLEHKLFENEDGSDAFEQFAAYGADANAYTTYNRTAYLFSCTEHFSEALEELLYFVTHPHFTDASVQKEQGIIAEEIREYEDSPWDRCYQSMLCAMYESNSVRENICGTVESIRRITPELLYECYRVFYNLSNMALVVCGDVTVEEVLAVADRILPREVVPVEVTRENPHEPPQVVSPYTEARMQVAKPIFSIGIKDPVIPADPAERLRRDLAMNLLCEILFSRSGEFYNALFEEGIITPGFGFGYTCTEGFAFTCLSGESDTPEVVLERLKSFLRDVSQNGIPEEDFERCRRALYADELRAYDSTEEIANRLLSFVFDGAEMLSCPSLLQSITKDELDALQKQVFREEYFTLSVMRPLE